MIRTGDTKTLLACLKSEMTYKVILKVVGFLNHILAFRILGLRAFGQLAFLDTAAGIAGTLVDVGFGGLLSRYLPLYKSASDGANRIYALVTVALLKTVVLGTACAAVLFVTADTWLPWLNAMPLSRYECAVFALNTLLVWVTSPIYSFLIQNYEVPYLNARTLWTNLFNIGAFYAAYLSCGISIASLLTIQLLTTSLGLVFVIVRYRHFLVPGLSLSQGLRSLRAETREMVRYTAVLWVSTLAEMVTARRGREYFIQTILGSEAMGLYAVGKKLEANILEVLFPKTMRETVGYRAYELWASSGAKAVRDFLEKYVTLSWLTVGAAVVPGIIALPYILRVVYKITGTADVIYLQFAVASILLLNWLPVMSHCINILRKPGWFIVAKAVTFPIALVLYAWLTHWGGLLGSLAAFTALCIGENVLYALVVRRAFGFPFSVPGVGAVLLSLAVTLSAGMFVVQASLASALVWGLVALFLYLGALAATGGGTVVTQLLNKTRFAWVVPRSASFVQALYRRN